MGRSDGSIALTQPLVSRPGYGGDGALLPRGHVGESKLPSGPPTERGLSLSDDIPGSRTFAKPEDDVREDKPEPGSIYRVDGPGDLAKPQDDAEPGDERDHSSFKPTYAPAGGRPSDDTSVTKYPYRDGIPNRHNAAEIVAGMYILATAAHEMVMRAGAEFETRTAARLDDIFSGLNPKVVDKAQRTCTATVVRSDIKNLRWIFNVDCGNGGKVVRMKAVRKGNVVKLGRMDLLLSCSCPAWRWLGSEYHSKREHYLDGKPRGTASVPKIKDPTNINRVCKHVAAALSLAKGWTIPGAKKPQPKPKTAAAAFKRACEVCLATEAAKDEVFEHGLLLTDVWPPLRVRAIGDPEFSTAVYQVRREDQPWPAQWESTDDLAGTLSRFVPRPPRKG